MKTKKSIMAILIICGFLLITWLPCQADGVLCGCAKINKGTLRIIDCSSQCLKSEYAVTLSGGAVGEGQTGKLACVTAGMRYPTETSAEFFLLNRKNIDVTDWSDVFNAIYIQPSPYHPESTYWGLQCKDDWINTGCSQSSTDGVNAGGDRDLPQYDNGCYSDNEEELKLVVITTCCKIVQ